MLPWLDKWIISLPEPVRWVVTVLLAWAFLSLMASLFYRHRRKPVE